MTNEERHKLAAYTAFIEEKIAQIKEAEEEALRLQEELKKWHLSDKGREYAKLYQQHREEILENLRTAQTKIKKL